MGDSKLEIRENTTYEIGGNLAYFRSSFSGSSMKWEARQHSAPAYIGRIVTAEEGDFFYGYIMSLWKMSVSSYGDCIKPIVGRFIKGRNNNTHIIFATIDDFACRCYMKKKIDEYNYGIFTSGEYSDKEWSVESFDGYFTCHAHKSYVANEEDGKAMADVIMSEYARLIKRDKKYQTKVDNFVKRFEYVKEKMLDLIDEREDIAATIEYPDEK